MANDWERLQARMNDAVGEDGFATAVGVHLGLAIALRHPEWAAAMCRAIDEEGMKRGTDSKPTSEIADNVVETVPMEVRDGE